jgi:uncharacterized protein
MFLRLLLILFLGWIIWTVGRRTYVSYWQNQKNLPTSPLSPPAEVMVRCAFCGLHVPNKEAIYSANTVFCCEAHKHAMKEIEQI